MRWSRALSERINLAEGKSMSSDMVHVSGADERRDGVRAQGEQAASDRRKPYRAPRLVVYGSVRELTLGGPGVSPDVSNTARSRKPKAPRPPRPCDPSVKQNILRIGTHPLGIGLYLFEYKPAFRMDGRRHFGVMADEVEQVMSEAVSRDENGIRQVDHALLGISDFAQQLEG